MHVYGKIEINKANFEKALFLTGELIDLDNGWVQINTDHPNKPKETRFYRKAQIEEVIEMNKPDDYDEDNY